MRSCFLGVASSIQYVSIADKDLYLIDGFFSPIEKEEAQEFSKNAPFSRKSYGSPEAVANGEKPAYSMKGYKVHYYLTSEHYEIDFLAQTARGEKKLVQVAWNTHEPETLEREERALQAGMKELKIPGEIITLDSYLQQPIR